MTEWIAEKIAYLLPKRVLYFAVIRVGADASLLTSTATSDAGYVALLRALHVRSAASIRANIAKLKDEATK